MAAIIVDGYCRVSTDPQEDNTSLDEQEACIRAYCAEQGLMIHRVIFTGYLYRENKVLELMRERYRDGKIQGVVVRTFDRLSRKQVHAAILMEEMEYHSVAFHCVMEPVHSEDKAMAQFIRSVLAFVAEMEREKIMDRLMTGRTNEVKKGNMAAVSTHKLRYGYQWNDPTTKEKIILNRKEAAVVRWMAIHYSKGVAANSLRDQLNERGVPGPKGAPWHETTIMRILGDIRITGQNQQAFVNKAPRYKTHHDTIDVPDGTWPRIISAELFNKCQRRMELNKAHANRASKTPEEFLLRAGYVRCSICGWGMGARTDTRYQHLAYRCRKHGSIVSKPLDAAIWQKVEELADHVTLIEEAIQLASSDTKLERDAAAINVSIARWEQTAANYLGDLEDPNLVGESRAAIRMLMNDANIMVRKLQVEQAQIADGLIDKAREQAAYQEILDWCKEVKEARGQLSYQRKRDFLELLGVVVTVIYDDKGKGNQSRPTYDMRVRLPALQEIISLPRTNESVLAAHTQLCSSEGARS